MAEYSNLASLEGLAVGDTVKYTTDTTIDFKGYKVKIELWGYCWATTKGRGGWTRFYLNTKHLKNKIFTFSTKGGCSLCYSDKYDAYYRIGVAGDAGTSKNATPGQGGGTTGGTGEGSYGGKGGSQTAGGKKGHSTYGTDGSFGTGGKGNSASGTGGAGWYGGGSGGYEIGTGYSQSGGGGGSGFIIGISTTTYPSGYLGDNQELIDELTAAVSDGKLNQGTSSSPVRMTLTIDSLPFNSETDTYVNLNYLDTVEKIIVNKNSSFENPNINISGFAVEGYFYDSAYKNPVTFPISVGTEEIDLYVKLKEIPIKKFDFTGAVEEITLTPGKYKLQVWGAQGGSYNSSYQGGYGGYSEGILTLKETTKAFIYVGGQPPSLTTASDPTSGGFNGGGKGQYCAYSGTYTYAQSGGGGTDIRLGTDSLYARVIVAGGGGGGSNSYSSGIYNYGGGEKSNSYSIDLIATQTTGYAFGQGQDGFGSSNYKYTSGGSGGGWYGGKSQQNQSDSINYSRNTAGGSGYVYTASTASNYPEGCLLNDSHYLEEAVTKGYSSNAAIPTTDGEGFEVGHSGNGYVIITTLEVETPEEIVLQSVVFRKNSKGKLAPANISYFNGTNLVGCDVYYFDGTSLKKIGSNQ